MFPKFWFLCMPRVPFVCGCLLHRVFLYFFFSKMRFESFWIVFVFDVFVWKISSKRCFVFLNSWISRFFGFFWYFPIFSGFSGPGEAGGGWGSPGEAQEMPGNAGEKPGAPRRVPESSGEPRGAPESSGELQRALESPGEQGGAT